MKKSTHGGLRKGSGRKKKEPTKTMRVPISKIPAIKEIIAGESGFIGYKKK